ncbi:hypothetical protein A2U01_0006622, partial [Trifolium medium]|nr:hypothetical protein [Trifolium medium]
NVCDIPLSQLPQACVKGDGLAIPIPEEEYLAGMDACKHNLHGRIVWPKGATPLTVVAVKEKLFPLWKDLSRWGITSLVGGFQSQFTEEHYNSASKPMFDRTFGHYARVLVDMDLSQTLRYKVLVERKGFAFFVELDYENLLEFYTHCKFVGHYLEICKKIQGNVNLEEHHHKEDRKKTKHKGEASKKFVQTRDGRQTLGKETEVIIAADPNPPVKDKQDNINVTELLTVAEDNQPDREGQPVIDNSISQALSKEQPEPSQQNRFSALADEDNNCAEALETVGIDRTEAQSEEQASTQDSEFVENTPQVVDKGFTEDLSLQTVNQTQSHDRLHHDMQFLNESWANMVEDEEQEQRLLETLEAAPDNSNFKMVSHRANKKAVGFKSSTSKSNYGTRSKVGPSKTSK